MTVDTKTHHVMNENEHENEPYIQNEVRRERKRGFCGSCRYVWANVTVEPTMMLFVIPCILLMLTSQNLSLDKACRVNLNFTDEICHSLRTQTAESQNEYERETQKLLARALSYRTYISATVPCILALLAGSWSDLTGHKKVFIIIPVVGQILACLNSFINIYFFYELKLEVLIFTEAVLEGFSGGWCLAFFTIYAYISAVTSVESRTFRMGITSFAMTVAFPIGMMLSGVLLKKFGYYGCYGLALAMHIINVIYISFFIKDPKRSPVQKQHDRRGVGHFFRTFFDLRNVWTTIQVVFKDGPRNRRVRMCVMMLVVSILFGPMYGEISILYMNTRYRFNWDELKFSVFQSYNFVLHTFGTIFSITVFSKYLQWHDSILGIISTISKISAAFIYCFAPNDRIFYLAPVVDILNGTSLLAMRSITSKLVNPDELGKVNSIFGLTENLMPLLYVPLYTNVYKATMEDMPGAVFLMGAAMTVPAVLAFIWLLYEHRNEQKTKQMDETTELPAKEPLMSPN